MEQDCISEVKRLSEREREQLLEKVYQLMANGVVVRDLIGWILEGSDLWAWCRA